MSKILVNCAAMRTSIFFLFIYAFTCTTALDYDDSWDRWSENLENNINKQINENLRPLENLGATIQSRLQENLRPLQNLGPNIQKQVYEGLRPVREMETRLRVKFGEGGTTIATFKDKKLIIQNAVLYECDGTISDKTGICSGKLSKAPFDKKEDFCYANVNTIINNWLCLSNGGSVNSGYINGKIYCNSPTNSPTLLISADEYKRLCENKTNPVTYTYYSTGPIGEHGPEIQCTEMDQKVICTMTESTNFFTNTGTSYININKK